MLTNAEMLNLAEFKFTPFRPRLVYALQLKSDKQVEEMRNLQNVEVKLEDLGQLDAGDKKDKEEGKKQKGDNDEEAGQRDQNETEEEKKVDEEPPEGDDLVDDAEFIEKMGTEPYITFAEFAKKMSLFNPRTSIDDKIQFYFRIFDVNEDKKIDKADLKKVMKMLFGSKLSADDMGVLGDKIFAEVLQSAEKDYLDQDDV